MRINVKKCIIVYSCLLAVSCSCFHKHVHTLTAKVNELFGRKSYEEDTTPPVWKIDNKGPIVSQYNNSNEKLQLLFGINWKNISSKIANNWWIIAVSSLLPFIVFWQIHYNMRKKLHGWKVLVQNKKSNTYSRRLTLPDLTLARHARRESLAEATQTLTNQPRKVSQCNISQFRSTRRNLYERNDNSSAEVKRVHIIRRRH